MKQLITIVLLIVTMQLQAQKKNIYIVAGSPQREIIADYEDEEIITRIFRLNSGSTLEPFLLVTDSTQQVLNVRHYSNYKIFMTFACQFENSYNSDYSSFVHKELDVENMKWKELIIPKSKQFNNSEYTLYDGDLNAVSINGELRFLFEYGLYGNDAITKKNHLIVIESDSSRYKEYDYSILNDIILNGSYVAPYGGRNANQLNLRGSIETNTLRIPSYLDNDSVFRTNIPANMRMLNGRTSAYLLLNNEFVQMKYFQEKETRRKLYELENKKTGKIWQFEYDGSKFNIKNFGDWIAMCTRLKSSKTIYTGKQIGDDRWIDEKTKYSMSIRRKISNDINKVILSGYLGIRHIDNPEHLIEWNTHQGDCEILLIEDEIVYYRKYDEIWKVPIINKEKLGEHVLLIKNNVIPAVHVMFTSYH